MTTDTTGSTGGFIIGEKHEVRMVVQDEHTAARYGSGLAPVLSTPHAAAMFETACKELAERHLQPGQTTVGTALTIRHTAPTPLAMAAVFRVELVAATATPDGKHVRLRFHGTAADDVEPIAECDHDRAVIDYGRFMLRVAAKTAKAKAEAEAAQPAPTATKP
jgi:predicted thioesterase